MNTTKLHPVFVVTGKLREKFTRKTVSSDSGCIIWVGAVDRTGYGAVKIAGRKMNAHVAAWRIAHGGNPVPVGKLIMHNCECRLCVNPEHLQLGTSSENMKHAHRSGRGQGFVCRGTDRPNAVLTEDLVRQIRSLYVPRVFGATRIAKQLGISADAVKGVVQGKTWRHIK